MKQSKLRRRRVIRFAITYYLMLVLFVGLIVGPSVAGNMVPLKSLEDAMGGLPFRLVQPQNQDNDNTNGTSATGTGHPDYTGVYQFTTSGDSSRETDKIKLF
jgi:1,3-beta-glucan synthase